MESFTQVKSAMMETQKITTGVVAHVALNSVEMGYFSLLERHVMTVTTVTQTVVVHAVKKSSVAMEYFSRSSEKSVTMVMRIMVTTVPSSARKKGVVMVWCRRN
jgi:hypothetical protein